MYFDYSEAKKLIDNILFCLCKSYWQTLMVSMNFRVSTNANKEKAIKKSKMVNSSSKNHSRTNSNRQNKESVKFVQTVSFDTDCDTLNRLNQLLSDSKNVIIGHLNINSMRHKFSSFKDLVFNEIDIFYYQKWNIDDSFPNSQFCAEG